MYGLARTSCKVGYRTDHSPTKLQCHDCLTFTLTSPFSLNFQQYRTINDLKNAKKLLQSYFVWIYLQTYIKFTRFQPSQVCLLCQKLLINVFAVASCTCLATANIWDLWLQKGFNSFILTIWNSLIIWMVCFKFN